ncbi:hypothetical protein TWF281_009805 [Arthrobotrys megalospora]
MGWHLEPDSTCLARTPRGLTSLPLELQIMILEYLVEFKDQLCVLNTCTLLRNIVSQSRSLKRARYLLPRDRRYTGLRAFHHNLFIQVPSIKTSGFHCIFQNGIAKRYLYKISTDLVLDVSALVDEPIFSQLDGQGKYRAFCSTARINRCHQNCGITDAIWVERASDMDSPQTIAQFRSSQFRLEMRSKSTIREWVDMMFRSLGAWCGIEDIGNNIEVRFSELFLDGPGPRASTLTTQWLIEARVVDQARDHDGPAALL